MKRIVELFYKYINKSTFRNVIYFSGGIVLFILGVIVYGVVLNLREIPLKEAMLLKGYSELVNTNIIIERRNFTLNLYEDTVLIKSYRANFGRNLSEAKSRAGDEATPVGEYRICSIDTAHKYHKFLRLNYPNISDITEGLRKGIITQNEFDSLKFEYFYEDCPELKTALGGNMGIHGIGEYNYIFKNLPFIYNWTDGSIAVSNEHIDEIYSVVKKGTKVVIK
ncbi:MAG TPA: L,D-transpeptidase [Ignavibacteriaceae bacterium]|nr:L,D-transpeptidase [Ignavibacteriaceae bacterium]